MHGNNQANQAGTHLTHTTIPHIIIKQGHADKPRIAAEKMVDQGGQRLIRLQEPHKLIWRVKSGCIHSYSQSGYIRFALIGALPDNAPWMEGGCSLIIRV